MSLSVTLQNRSTMASTYAFITGTDSSGRLFLLQADGVTPYYPASPSSTGAALAVNCAINMGSEGTNVNVTIPYLSGARIWFSNLTPLIFLLNPGPALVEPSVTNSADPSHSIQWDFCEFTFNSAQLFINISYVDFVCLPVSLTVTSSTGAVSHVSGLPSGARDTIATNLRAQQAKDGRPWSNLIVNNPSGSVLRILSPNNALMMDTPPWDGYFVDYVNQVWEKYSSGFQLTVNTQAQWGDLTATVVNNQLTFPGGIAFNRPTTADIFACQGAFNVTSVEQGAISARLAAAFNRTTLIQNHNVPDPGDPGAYYINPVTNHYARIVHAANLDNRGYCFPYDDESLLCPA